MKKEMMLKKLTISKDESLRKAIIRLDEGGEQIVLIVDSRERLCGVMTDGDVRRYILSHKDLDVPVSRVIKKDYLYLNEKDKGKAALLLRKNRFNHIPIVDDDGILIDLVSVINIFKQANKQKMNNVIIMAGGKGTRLLPVTKIIPKPLIPVGEKTMIETIIDNFTLHGFNKFNIVVNYKKELIKSYFAENKIKGDIKFIDEKKFLGTAGGLCYLKGKLKEAFVLSNCDILATANYDAMLEWHYHHKADITILGLAKKFDIPYGVIEVTKDNYVASIKEKPNYNLIINTGIYIFEPSIIDIVPHECFYDMDKLINDAIRLKKKVTCYPIDNGYHDVGQFEGYSQFLKKFEV